MISIRWGELRYGCMRPGIMWLNGKMRFPDLHNMKLWGFWWRGNTYIGLIHVGEKHKDGCWHKPSVKYGGEADG